MVIGKAKIQLRISQKDELAVINDSSFYICPACGYGEHDAKAFKHTKLVAHQRSSGSKCGNKILSRYALGYRFATNVIQLRFLEPILEAGEYSIAYSVLQGILQGFTSYCSIDDRDVAGTLSYYLDETDQRGMYAIVLYDNSPGGSGYVKLLEKPDILEGSLRKAFQIVTQCKCGGERADTSCYSCLQSYYNQKHHEEIKRSYVIDFLRNILE